MNILGIGPLELVMMLIVFLLVFKPSDLIVMGRKLGKFIYSVKNSDYWNTFREFEKSISQAGQSIMRDSSLDEMKQKIDVMPDLKKIQMDLNQKGFIPNLPSNEDSSRSNPKLDVNEKE
jgi:Sec-independent protein translocase protein TatA